MLFPPRRSGPSRLFCLVVLLGLTACERPASDTKPAQTSVDWFIDDAHAAGLDFTHFNGMSGHFYYPEIMAPGVALLDYDNDGDLDWFVSSIWDPTGNPEGGDWDPTGNRLYRNKGDGTFEDVTETAGAST